MLFMLFQLHNATNKNIIPNNHKIKTAKHNTTDCSEEIWAEVKKVVSFVCVYFCLLIFAVLFSTNLFRTVIEYRLFFGYIEEKANRSNKHQKITAAFSAIVFACLLHV